MFCLWRPARDDLDLDFTRLPWHPSWGCTANGMFSGPFGWNVILYRAFYPFLLLSAKRNRAQPEL